MIRRFWRAMVPPSLEKKMMPRMIKHLVISLFVMLPLAMVGCGGGVPDSPTAMFDAAREAAVKNQPVLVWNTLPSSWQADVDDLIHEIGRKVPAELYDKTMDTARKVVQILKTKKQFVWNTPLVKMQMSQMTPKERADAETAYDAIVTLGEALTQSDLSTAAGLQRFNVKSFLTKYGSRIHTALVAVIRTAAAQEPEAQMFLMVIEGIKNLKASVVSESGSTAVVSITMAPIGQENMDMVKVDGKWVPKEMAEGSDSLPAALAMAKVQLSSQDFSTSSAQVMQVTMMLSMVDAVIGPLEKANTQAEFDQALAGIAALMGGGGPPPGAG